MMKINSNYVLFKFNILQSIISIAIFSNCIWEIYMKAKNITIYLHGGHFFYKIINYYIIIIKSLLQCIYEVRKNRKSDEISRKEMRSVCELSFSTCRNF
jgi:hypothetical protein